MSNLLNSLATAAESMRAMQSAIDVGGNNISNAKTPNYVKQRLDLEAQRFELNRGLTGGVAANGLISSRKTYLDKTVQEQNHSYGRFAQQTSDLESLEPIFEVGNGAGLGGAIDGLFQSFSAWSVAPNDTPTRQSVLNRAGALAQSFRFTAASLASAKSDGQDQVRSTVVKINELGAKIQKYNLEVRADARNLQDPGLEAGVYQQLESLSELVDFNAVRSTDGSFTVNLGGQTPLTIGGNLFPISADLSGPTAVVKNAQGQDITGQIQLGRLRAQLDQQNTFLPGLNADLNRLASTIADKVNSTLGGGLDQNGTAPSTALFTYDAAGGAAATLAVNPLDTAQLAGAAADSPGGNGNALALSDLGQARAIDNNAFGQFYGTVAGRVGQRLANSRNDENTQSLLVAQARNVRASDSEVSIDEEAANLVAFQRQYEANAELVRILNSLTETTINIIR